MLYGPRESQVKDLTLAHCVQAKKAVPVPTCARYGLGDMGKAAKVRPTPREALSSTMSLSSLSFGGRAARPD
jgi:hypothetical protein